MEYKVELAPRVRSQLFHAYEFALANGGKAVADRWLNRFTKALQNLAVFPERHSVPSDNKHLKPGYRVMLFGKRKGAYHAYFVVNSNAIPTPWVRVVYIARAAHGPLSQEDLEE